MNLTPTPTPIQSFDDDYLVDGIRVERYMPHSSEKSTPLICVHGGGQASWCWEDFAPILREHGFEVHALNWRGRNGSAQLERAEFLKGSIADVVTDISVVASQFKVPPILVGHSMGALACQLYAQDFPVKALLLLTPVFPSEAGAPAIELAVDESEPWGPLPLPQAKELFFQGLDDAKCSYLYPKLVPESPLRVFEATRWALSVDIEKITMPTLIISGALDILTPAQPGQQLAQLYGAEYRLEPDLGHNVVLGERGIEIAHSVVPWLTAHA